MIPDNLDVFTHPMVAFLAHQAIQAGNGRGHHHTVTPLKIARVPAQFLDHAGNLMPGNTGKLHGVNFALVQFDILAP